MGFLSTLDRFNRAHPWSHNDAFAGFVLRQANAVRRKGGKTAADVGCGTGNLIVRLARVFPEVRGIEPDPATAAIAKARFSGTGAVRIEQHPFEEDHATYDFVVFVASLHHMPLAETLQHARTNLRPGGRIVIVGVARETSADAPRSLLSLALNPLVGLFRHPRRAELAPPHMRAPTAAADDSVDEIQHVAGVVLPGIRLRRRLFWRYTATWSQPA